VSASEGNSILCRSAHIADVPPFRANATNASIFPFFFPKKKTKKKQLVCAVTLVLLFVHTAE